MSLEGWLVGRKEGWLEGGKVGWLEGRLTWEPWPAPVGILEGVLLKGPLKDLQRTFKGPSKRPLKDPSKDLQRTLKGHEKDIKRTLKGR